MHLNELLQEGSCGIVTGPLCEMESCKQYSKVRFTRFVKLTEVCFVQEMVKHCVQAILTFFLESSVLPVKTSDTRSEIPVQMVVNRSALETTQSLPVSGDVLRDGRVRVRQRHGPTNSLVYEEV